MTFSSWPDVPEGVPVHHHCTATWETAYDPKYWFDPTNTEPQLVAWDPSDATGWMYEQIKLVLPEAGDQEAATIQGWISDFADMGEFWDRQWRALAHGHWLMLPVWASPGRKLVLQVVCHADRDQSGVGPDGRAYTVCRRHDRPENIPYLGVPVKSE